MTFHCVPKGVFVPKKKRVHTGLGRKTEVENLPNSVVESEVYFKKKNSRDGKVYFIFIESVTIWCLRNNTASRYTYVCAKNLYITDRLTD